MCVCVDPIQEKEPGKISKETGTKKVILGKVSMALKVKKCFLLNVLTFEIQLQKYIVFRCSQMEMCKTVC